MTLRSMFVTPFAAPPTLDASDRAPRLNVAVFGCDPTAKDDPLGRFQRTLDVLQRARIAADDSMDIRLVVCGMESRETTLAPGITLCSLAVRQPLIRRTAASWAISRIAAEADLVHLWRFDWRSCDAALLAARLAGVPVIANDVAADFATLASQLGLARFVDRKIALDELLADDGGAALWNAYRSLVPAARRREAA